MRLLETDFVHWFLALLIFVGGIVCGNCWGSMARAEDLDPDREYALAIAATGTNEAGMRSTRDFVLIYQVSQYHGRGSNERALRWLRRHSARVNGSRHCAPGRNCEWTRNLRWNNERPTGFPEGALWRPRTWEHARNFALRVVRGDAPQRVCTVDVLTWGSASDFESNRFGWVPVDCGARNLGGTTAALIDAAHAARTARGARAVDLR